MQRYVTQLLAQYKQMTQTCIAEREAERANDPANGDWDDPDSSSFEAHIAMVEADLEGRHEFSYQSLASILGIDLSELPPPEKLSASEADALYEALVGFMAVLGYPLELYLADDTPPMMLYSHLLKVLKATDQQYAQGDPGFGCQVWAIGCEFGKYCGCLDCWSRESFIKEGGDPSIPEDRFPSMESLIQEYPEFYDATSPSYQSLHRRRKRNEQARDWRLANGHAQDDQTLQPPPPSVDLMPLQNAIDNWIDELGVRYFSELTNMAILTEEVGELARLAARVYGDQSFKREEDAASAKTDWADELSDVLFVLVALANQTGVDLTEAFEKGMAKRTVRDGDRHWNNPKLF